MPWKETDVRSQRIAFVVEALRRQRSMAGLCRSYGISRKTGYKWLHRYREVGSLARLDELSRCPHRSPGRTPEWIECRVEELRLTHGWAGRKIRRRLADEGIRIARSTVDRILQRRGLVGPRRAHRPALKRFERSQPNELWQMDFKGPYLLGSGALCYPLSILDDHSRYAVALEALPSQHGRHVASSLSRCWERYGVPQAMLMDHGSPWWATSNGHGLTRLSVALIRQGIDLIYGSIGHPQTLGKVERFHRTLGAGLALRGLPTSLQGFAHALASFRREYNELRPHEALDDETPARRYRPSRKAYEPNPPQWEYPSGANVRRVTDSGLVKYRSRQYFVCHALAGERVCCQRFGTRMLVTYRHMQIREIDLATGRTTAIVRPENWRNVLPMS